MFCLRVLLAKVMTQAKEDDATAAAVGRWSRHRTPDLGEPPRTAAPGRAARARTGRARALGHPAGRPGDAGTARRDVPRGTGRAREGAAAFHDPRHRGPGRLAARDPGAASHRPSPGDAHRDPGRPGAGAEGTPAPGSLAGQAAGRAEPAGAGHAAGRRADPGEAQPVLTGRPRRLLAARPWRRPATQPRRSWLRTFASLGTRNY